MWAKNPPCYTWMEVQLFPSFYVFRTFIQYSRAPSSKKNVCACISECKCASVSYHWGWIACRIWVCHGLGSEPPLPLRPSPHSPKPGVYIHTHTRTHHHTHTQRNSFSNNENIELTSGLSPAQGFLFTFWFGLISSPHSAVFFDITPQWNILKLKLISECAIALLWIANN